VHRNRATSLAALVASGCVAMAACGGSDGNSQASTLAAALQLQHQGQLAAAKQLYQHVIAAQPSNYVAHYDLGVIAQQQGDDSTALAEYGAALTAHPNYVPALYNQATIYQRTDPATAIDIYRRIIALQPHAPSAYFNLGLLETRSGSVQRGIQDLAQAVSQQSDLLGRVPKRFRTVVATVTGSS
jgi:Tfp pilus assembly protein PilF